MAELTLIGYANATYIGRFVPLTQPVPCMAAISAGSRVRIHFNGPNLSLGLWLPNRTHQIAVDISIDGNQPQRRYPTTETMEVAEGLSDATHTCEIWLAGNDENDLRWINHYGLAIRGFYAKEVWSWPTTNSRTMLTIGDSIREGDLALGVGPAPDYEQPIVDSGRTCPGNLLGDLLQIDNYNFAFSGASVSNSFTPGGYPKMSTMIAFAMNGIPAIDPNYDIVYIALGANDGATPSATFRVDYAALLQYLSTTFPQARIYCEKPINNWAPARAADIEFVATLYDCIYVDTSNWVISAPHLNHPDLAGQLEIATHEALIVSTNVGAPTINTRMQLRAGGEWHDCSAYLQQNGEWR